MTLSSMVVSRDWQEVSVLECILGGLHMDVAVEEDPQQAMSRLTKSKIDALIVDCDLDGSSRFLQQLQHPEKHAQTVPLVIMGAARHRPALEETGAMFAFEKPISVEQAVRTLSAARSLILDGRLRYHRAGLDVPVTVECKGRSQTECFLVNVSLGGMQIYSEHQFQPTARLQLSFQLPGIKSLLKARAEIAWQDRRGHVGIHFLKIAPRQQQALRLWLAQQYFTN